MDRRYRNSTVMDSLEFDEFLEQTIDEEIFDRAIEEAIADLLTPSSASKKPILRRGSRGPAVVELQKLLTKAGFRLQADGIFGSKTDAAVRRFQRSRVLYIDGIVGKNTWAALLGSPRTSPPVVFPSYPSTVRGLTKFKRRVREIALKEWQFFNRGTKKEYENVAYQRVGDYWKQGLGRNLDGRDRDAPWSAAFISWVMKKAGAGNKFKYSASHSVYIREAIKNRKNNVPHAGFKGYKINEVAPKVGDLVCASRGKDAGKVGYDTTRSYSSHCDIVVATRPGEIDVIGGNVKNSVWKRPLKIDSQGKLIDRKKPWFVVIKNLL